MLQVYDNIISKTSAKQFANPEQAFNYIKGENRDDLEKIKLIRELSLVNDVNKSSEITSLKQSLPLILWNFQSNGRRNQAAITESTGLMYFDIDYNIDYEFNDVYFYAYWKSVRNTGFGSLVKVKDVTKDNFKKAYAVIAKTLGIPFDPVTVKATQLNILSYDPHIKINEDSFVFEFAYLSNETDVNDQIEKKLQSIEENSFNKNSLRVDTFSKLRYDNFDEKASQIKLEYDANGLCDLADKKIHYTQIYFPAIIPEGIRHGTLQKIIIQLLALNPHATLCQITEFMRMVNNEKCQPRKSVTEIDKLCKSCFKSRKDFVVIPNKTRRFFFEDQRLDKESKLGLMRTYLNKETADRNQKTILEGMKTLIDKGKEFKLKELMNVTKIKTSRTLINHLKRLKDQFLPHEWLLLKTNAKI